MFQQNELNVDDGDNGAIVFANSEHCDFDVISILPSNITVSSGN